MEPDHLAQLSRRYARYSHSLPGLSLALGGLVMLLLLFAPLFLDEHAHVCWENQRGLLALIVALLLAGWLLIKEWMRQRIYQSLGIAEARSSTAEIVFTKLLATAIALVAFAYPVKALAAQPHPDPLPTDIQIYVGLTACLALPWCTLRFIRGVQEGILWFILCFWGLALAWIFPLAEPFKNGEGPLAMIVFLTIPLAYFGGLIVGLVQHFNFMRLAREIRSQETPDE
ncbi:MAG TPA: hypothetical protein VNV60_07460 [Holophagaceae bacterium]|jgi:hypothetical protein|nr:hypothetical protein [Holophagaceae bacterium]